MDYQWDNKKAESNIEKHGIDFADAVGVFEDDYSLTLQEKIVNGEQRFVTIGIGFLGRIIVVVYTFRDDIIRIISARYPTKRERETYEQRRI